MKDSTKFIVAVAVAIAGAVVLAASYQDGLLYDHDGNGNRSYASGGVRLGGGTTPQTKTNLNVDGELAVGSTNDPSPGVVTLYSTNGTYTAKLQPSQSQSANWRIFLPTAAFSGLMKSTASGTDMSLVPAVAGTDYAAAGSSGSGYVLTAAATSGASPSDASTVYMGATFGLLGVAYNDARIYVPKAGTLKAAVVKMTCTAGSNEAGGGVYIRINDTTDVTLSTSVTYDASPREVNNTSLNTAVSVGDYVAIKVVYPTWATNPSNVRWTAYIYIE
jgi:hypothetical protein